MQRTLFFLPHDILGIPVFGFGWALVILGLVLVIRLAWAAKQGAGAIKSELSQSLVFWVVTGAVIVFVLPSVEIRAVNGEPIGIAVRGYGVFLLLGVASGFSLAAWRAKKANIELDHIFSLALWMFIGGIGGARLFYIIEYRESFLTGSLTSTIGKMLDFTRGGLVVYGSIIGGTIAVLAFSYRRRLSALRLCDVIIPSLFIGLFFGRLGCLMNGCCYGGRCEEAPYALHFPAGSPVYVEQLESGALIGLELAPLEPDAPLWPRRVAAVDPDGLAASAGISAGAQVSKITTAPPLPQDLDPQTAIDDASQQTLAVVADDRAYVWTADQLPSTALPVLPSQVISSLTGLIVCGILLTVSALVSLRPGVLTALGFGIYSIARFGEEIVRSDEPGQFGTELSISQWVSLLVLPAAIGLIIYIYWFQPASTAGKTPANSGTGQQN